MNAFQLLSNQFGYLRRFVEGELAETLAEQDRIGQDRTR